MKIVFAAAILFALMYFAFIQATDRICDKPFSKEFKQSEQYKAMQCE